MKNGKWIWKKGTETPDSYVEFMSVFDSDGTKTVLYIAAETDAVAYVNGRRVSFMSFAGYRDEKYYDKIDITDFCRRGENVLTVTVRYEGRNTSTHIDDGAGLIFEVVSGEDVLCFSSEKTLCRIDERYVQGVCRLVTGQLGYSSNMKNAECGEYENAVPTGRNCVLKKRPVERCDVLPGLEGKDIHADGKMIYDLGREECGYVYLSVNAEEDTLVKVAYGEHIVDGEVRRLVGGRDFSLDFHCKKGENSFEQMFVRIAGRYLQIICDDPIEVVKIGIYPVMYPLTEKKREFDGLYGDIYKTCVRTLRLCMHTHYEDCPWREQALYV
ncbi:MAG: family 78 glycoside hydrolase catalytic domain, partial [Firmicutes bacterium]|nr:family 78 glycoside hydrolase catalytic domain [Candidatus Colimorpha enterica]